MSAWSPIGPWPDRCQPLVVFALVFGAFRLLLAVPTVQGWWDRIGRRATPLLLTAAGLLLISYAALVVWYVTIESFSDHLEPTVAAVSWLAVGQGKPIYHALDAASRYSMLYGPLVYLVNGWVLQWVGPSLTAAKLAGGVSALGALGCTALAVARRCGWRWALAASGWMAASSLIFVTFSFWTRGDPLLVGCLAVGVAAIACRRPIVSALLAGAALGIGINLKLHAPIYFAPLLMTVSRLGRRWLLVSVACAAAVGLAPILLVPQVSLSDYLAWLRVASRHGIQLELLVKTSEYAAFFSIPLLGLVILAWRHRAVERVGRHARELAALAIALVLMTVASSKPGSGPHHLLPFLPVIAWLTAVMAKDLPQRFWSSGRGASHLAAAVSVSTLLLAAPIQWRMVPWLHRMSGYPVAEDVRRALAQHPGRDIGMGYGDDRSYLVTFSRPLLAFSGEPYWLDAGALMDMQEAGLPLPAATLEAIRSCATDVWLIPRESRPFTMANFYSTHEPLFDRGLRELFERTYERTGHTEFFDVWQCRQSSR